MEKASAEIDYKIPVNPEVVRQERMGFVKEARDLLIMMLESKHLEDDQLQDDPLICARAILYFMLG